MNLKRIETKAGRMNAYAAKQLKKQKPTRSTVSAQESKPSGCRLSLKELRTVFCLES